MAYRKVRAYLRGQDVSFEEMSAAALAPTDGTLMADLSRLVTQPGSGIERVSQQRGRGRHSSYRYSSYRYRTPAPPSKPTYITVRRIGTSSSGNALVEDPAGSWYELTPVGQRYEGESSESEGENHDD